METKIKNILIISFKGGKQPIYNREKRVKGNTLKAWVSSKYKSLKFITVIKSMQGNRVFFIHKLQNLQESFLSW